MVFVGIIKPRTSVHHEIMCSKRSYE